MKGGRQYSEDKQPPPTKKKPSPLYKGKQISPPEVCQSDHLSIYLSDLFTQVSQSAPHKERRSKKSSDSKFVVYSPDDDYSSDEDDSNERDEDDEDEDEDLEYEGMYVCMYINYICMYIYLCMYVYILLYTCIYNIVQLVDLLKYYDMIV